MVWKLSESRLLMFPLLMCRASRHMSALMENSHSTEITEMSESGLEFLFIQLYYIQGE